MSLSAFSTCEISDALVKLGHRHGGLLPEIHPIPSPAAVNVCGPAYTVQIVLTSNTSTSKLSSHFVDTAPADHVIVIQAPPEAKNAVWGGLMTAGAQARGAIGVVISGNCRDLGEHRAANFPVFARGHSTVGQSPFTRPAAVNVPLLIGEMHQGENTFPAVEVTPGDWIVADEDGVVCVPAALIAKVVELATKGRAVDALCLEDIKAGKGVQASFKKHRG